MTTYVKTITEQPDRIVITAEDTAGKQVNIVLSKELAKQLLDALFFAQTENHTEIPLPERKGRGGAFPCEIRDVSKTKRIEYPEENPYKYKIMLDRMNHREFGS